MKKAYLFCLTHALPTAMLMTEDGDVVESHSGSDADDAKAWFYHFKKDKGYEVIEVDQSLIHKHLYEGASLDIFKEKYSGFLEAFHKNQEKGKQAKQKQNG